MSDQKLFKTNNTNYFGWGPKIISGEFKRKLLKSLIAIVVSDFSLANVASGGSLQGTLETSTSPLSRKEMNATSPRESPPDQDGLRIIEDKPRPNSRDDKQEKHRRR